MEYLEGLMFTQGNGHRLKDSAATKIFSEKSKFINQNQKEGLPAKVVNNAAHDE